MLLDICFLDVELPNLLYSKPKSNQLKKDAHKEYTHNCASKSSKGKRTLDTKQRESCYVGGILI